MFRRGHVLNFNVVPLSKQIWPKQLGVPFLLNESCGTEPANWTSGELQRSHGRTAGARLPNPSNLYAPRSHTKSQSRMMKCITWPTASTTYMMRDAQVIPSSSVSGHTSPSKTQTVVAANPQKRYKRCHQKRTKSTSQARLVSSTAYATWATG